MSRRAKFAVLLGSVAVVLGFGAGFAFASIPAPDGTINACYKPSDGKLFVIDSTATCPSGTTALNWNQTGPPGPSTAGATGLDLVLVQGTGTSQAVASCPSDHPYVVSGGFSMASASANASFPVSGNGNGTGPEGTSGNGWEASNATGSFIDVFAICAK